MKPMTCCVFLSRACILVTILCAHLVAAPVTQSSQNARSVDLGELNKIALKIPIVVPPIAVRAGAHGVVRVRVWISKKGDVIRTLVVSGPRSLRSSAVRSARGSKFQPNLGDCPACRYVTGVMVYTFAKQDHAGGER